MRITVDDELKQICKNIVSENLNLSQWQEIESEDIFQTKHYCGGFDATENAFCLSYFNSENQELWFQLTIDEVQKILSGEIFEFNARPAN